MKLRTLLAADAVVFVVAAIVLVALFPNNVDTPDPSPVYKAAWIVVIASLLVLIVGGLVALAKYFAKPS